MKRDPRLRAIVRRGYLNLALFLSIVVIGLIPVLLYRDPRGIKIAAIGCSVFGLAFAIWRRFTRR